jgi:hypothetical protein
MMHNSRKVFLWGSLILLIPIVLTASATSLQEQALFLQHTDNGLAIIEQAGLPYTGVAGNMDDPAVVWSHYLTDAIYTTAANTVGGYVFAGTYLNPPMEAQLFAPGGGGTPEWGYGGTELYVDAGDTTFTLAAVDDYGSGVYVSKWTGPGDTTPDWMKDFPGYGVSSYGPFAVSDDGSTIAAIAAPSGADAHLLLFDADSSEPLIDYVATGLGFPRYVKINADGRYTAFIALATIVIFDRDLLNVRSQISMGFSNSALDISGDGNVIAYGWPSLQVRQWNGSSYQSLWTYNAGANYYVGTIAISNDGSTIVSCWYTTTFTTLKVVVHDIGSSTPLWIYDYPVSSGAYQEDPMDVDITDDGQYFIVGSLGDDANINPEVHIFQRDNTPHIYYTVDMPGSVFSVDIANDGSYATAAGKHIHANAMGRGGDVVLINTDILGITNTESINVPVERLSLNIYPNPFKYETTIRFMIDDARCKEQELQNSNFAMRKHIMKIYDATGRLVKSFNLESRIQNRESPVSWNGTDSSNRKLPGGVYFVQLETEGQTITKKITKSE